MPFSSPDFLNIFPQWTFEKLSFQYLIYCIKWGYFTIKSFDYVKVLLFLPLQAGLDYSVHVFCLGVMLKAWTKICLGQSHACVMLFVLKVALLWQLQLQFSVVLTHHILFVRVYYLHGGCVGYTQVLFGNPCRKNIIWR